jgi:hypothetical protein
MADLFNLDFNEAKESFKTFLQNHEDFSDYNFEGSAINNLLDVFAYFLQTFSFYLNGVANEMFISTAQQSDNIYKLANQLNYLPRRKVAPSITVTIARKAGVTTSIHIPAYSTWTMGSLTLSNLVDIDITTGDSQEITLYEGAFSTETFISDGTDFQTYALAEREKIDNTNLFVYVDTPDGTGGYTLGTENWKPINLLDLNDSGNNYYIDYFSDMSIKFDNGQVFNKPAEDDRIRAIYLVTNGVTNNGATGTITLDDAVNNSLVDITNPSSNVLINGLAEETTTAIKNRASGYFSTQGRAVTQSDFDNLLQKFSAYDTFEDATAWSGHLEFIDTNNDIQETSAFKDLGHVYLSAIKTGYSYLSNAEKKALVDFFNDKKFVTIFMRFLHPNIIDVIPSISVKYKSTVLPGFASTLIADINTYLDGLEGFSKTFNKSNLDNFVDTQDNVDYMSSTYTTQVTIKSGPEVESSATGTTTLTLVDSSLANVFEDDYFNGFFLHHLTGTNSPQGKYIVDYDGASGTFTFADELDLADATNFTEGGAITGDSDGGNDGVGIVSKKIVNKVYVNTTSGSWVATNGVDNVDPFVGDETTISAVTAHAQINPGDTYDVIDYDEHKVIRLNGIITENDTGTTVYHPSSTTSYTTTGGSTTTLIDTTNLKNKYKDDYWNLYTIKHLTGTNAPQTLTVTDYDDSTGTLTFSTANAINAGDTYRLQAPFTTTGLTMAQTVHFPTGQIGTFNRNTGFMEYDYNFAKSSIIVPFKYEPNPVIMGIDTTIFPVGTYLKGDDSVNNDGLGLVVDIAETDKAVVRIISGEFKVGGLIDAGKIWVGPGGDGSISNITPINQFNVTTIRESILRFPDITDVSIL